MTPRERDKRATATPQRKLPPQAKVTPPPPDRDSNRLVKWNASRNTWDTVAEHHTEGRTFKPRKAANPHE